MFAEKQKKKKHIYIRILLLQPSQMANSVWSEENSPQLYLFHCALVTVEFSCETCYIDSMVKTNLLYL